MTTNGFKAEVRSGYLEVELHYREYTYIDSIRISKNLDVKMILHGLEECFTLLGGNDGNQNTTVGLQTNIMHFEHKNVADLFCIKAFPSSIQRHYTIYGYTDKKMTREDIIKEVRFIFYLDFFNLAIQGFHWNTHPRCLKIEEGHASGSNTHLLLLENSFIVN
jgi:hypothetical protein